MFSLMSSVVISAIYCMCSTLLYGTRTRMSHSYVTNTALDVSYLRYHSFLEPNTTFVARSETRELVLDDLVRAEAYFTRAAQSPSMLPHKLPSRPPSLVMMQSLRSTFSQVESRNWHRFECVQYIQVASGDRKIDQLRVAISGMSSRVVLSL